MSKTTGEKLTKILEDLSDQVTDSSEQRLVMEFVSDLLDNLLSEPEADAAEEARLIRSSLDELGQCATVMRDEFKTQLAEVTNGK